MRADHVPGGVQVVMFAGVCMQVCRAGLRRCTCVYRCVRARVCMCVMWHTAQLPPGCLLGPPSVPSLSAQSCGTVPSCWLGLDLGPCVWNDSLSTASPLQRAQGWRGGLPEVF